ncbi:TPA: hypothetical protein AB5C39_001837 [Vibrio mimicus]|nr:hypothetical protein [Vibrio cholerae]EKF9121574.1 hypothetical protein [Vibrio cholerae]
MSSSSLAGATAAAMMMHNQHEAYKRGVKAAQSGESRESNPEFGTMEKHGWYNGFDDVMEGRYIPPVPVESPRWEAPLRVVLFIAMLVFFSWLSSLSA